MNMGFLMKKHKAVAIGLAVGVLFLSSMDQAKADDTKNTKQVPAKTAPPPPPPARSSPPPPAPAPAPPPHPQQRPVVQTSPPTSFPTTRPSERGTTTVHPGSSNNPHNPNGPRPGPTGYGPSRPDTPSRPVFNPPQGTLFKPRPDGTATVTHPDGRRWEMNVNGRPSSFSKPGLEARFGTDGRASYVRDDRRGVTITHAPNGARQVVSVNSDGARIVSSSQSRGFVERSLRAGLIQRTYVVNGRPRAAIYRIGSYRGVAYQSYTSSVYYRPAFYKWATESRPVPFTYSWNWRDDAWYGAQAGYFKPAAVYTSAPLWIADYVLAENIRLAYDDQRQGPSGSAAFTPVTPEVKMAVAEQVRREVSSEQAMSTQQAGPAPAEAPPPALDPSLRIFVVSSNLDAKPRSGGTCALTPGDIIQRSDDRMGSDNMVAVSVLSSKAGDCAADTVTSLHVAALQEMHNQFRQQVDAGLAALSENQGTGGLPSGPAAGGFTSRDAQGMMDANSEAALIRQQQQSANQTELELQVSANNGQ